MHDTIKIYKTAQQYFDVFSKALPTPGKKISARHIVSHSQRFDFGVTFETKHLCKNESKIKLYFEPK